MKTHPCYLEQDTYMCKYFFLSSYSWCSIIAISSKCIQNCIQACIVRWEKDNVNESKLYLLFSGPLWWKFDITFTFAFSGLLWWKFYTTLTFTGSHLVKVYNILTSTSALALQLPSLTKYHLQVFFSSYQDARFTYLTWCDKIWRYDLMWDSHSGAETWPSRLSLTVSADFGDTQTNKQTKK